jgi:hypothetical protein
VVRMRFSIRLLMGLLCWVVTANPSVAAESWSPVLNVKLLFAQAKREDPNHIHSEKISISLSDMSWLPAACTDRNYVYIEKTDTHLYSLLMAAMVSKTTVQLAVTNLQPLAGVCRVTMVGSPSWN